MDNIFDSCLYELCKPIALKAFYKTNGLKYLLLKHGLEKEDFINEICLYLIKNKTKIISAAKEDEIKLKKIIVQKIKFIIIDIMRKFTTTKKRCKDGITETSIHNINEKHEIMQSISKKTKFLNPEEIVSFKETIEELIKKEKSEKRKKELLILKESING